MGPLDVVQLGEVVINAFPFGHRHADSVPARSTPGKDRGSASLHAYGESMEKREKPDVTPTGSSAEASTRVPGERRARPLGSRPTRR